MTIDCLPLPVFDDQDLGAVRAAFEGAAPIPLGQAWRAGPEPDFAPGIVRTGRRADTVWVWATLEDADIFTHADRHNGRFWELGDTFEMFFQPPDGTAYVEFHVTPNNLRLQLRFSAPPPPPRAGALDPFDAALIRADVFHSRTWVDHAAGMWWVLAGVPARSVGHGPLAGARWRVSFSRYDYTHGRERPVISSSSPHAEPGFHRQHEWGVLRFV